MEEPGVSDIMTTVLERSGIQVRAGSGVDRVSDGPTLHLADGSTITGSHLFVAVGRRPASAGMDLDTAGVQPRAQKRIVTACLRAAHHRLMDPPPSCSARTGWRAAS